MPLSDLQAAILRRLLFLNDGVPVQPQPDQVPALTEHPGRRAGHWPSSPEIGSPMLGA